jgi:hypothetical protein
MKDRDKTTVTRASDKFMLRLPDGMRERIAQEARANNRSMNAEMVARLQDSLEARRGQPDMDEFVDQLAEKLALKLKGKKG